MIEVVMPKMGESITEGTIIEWKKEIGDKVDKDEVLLEISTDKVDSEVPSPASGILAKINGKVNEKIPVGNVIAYISKEVGEANELIKEDIEYNADKKINKENNNIEIASKNITIKENLIDNYKISKIEKSNKAYQKFYSPLVKSIAKKENISLEELDAIAGSGLNGRVNKKDILLYIKEKNINKIEREDQKCESPSTLEKLTDSIEPMSRMRKTIAEHMVNSIKTSPHVYTTVEADVTGLVKISKEYKDKFLNKTGTKLTYTQMIIDVCIKAIQDFPLLNASIDNENIIHHSNINLGVAVALPDNNLIVPVIHKAEEKNFLGLARTTSDLAERAKNNKLEPNEIFGSTFTVTNPGIFGGLFGMGIINQPNVGILAVGAFQKRPVVKTTEYGDSILVRNMVYLTLSYDHRIIDGAYGTKFLSKLVNYLENYNSQRILG